MGRRGIAAAPRRFSEMKLLSIKVTIEYPSRSRHLIFYKLQVAGHIGYKFIANEGKYSDYSRPRKLNRKRTRQAVFESIDRFFPFLFPFYSYPSLDNYCIPRNFKKKETRQAWNNVITLVVKNI